MLRLNFAMHKSYYRRGVNWPRTGLTVIRIGFSGARAHSALPPSSTPKLGEGKSAAFPRNPAPASGVHEQRAASGGAQAWLGKTRRLRMCPQRRRNRVKRSRVRLQALDELRLVVLRGLERRLKCAGGGPSRVLESAGGGLPRRLEGAAGGLAHFLGLRRRLFVETMTSHMRERVGLMTEQAKELAAVSQAATRSAVDALAHPQR